MIPHAEASGERGTIVLTRREIEALLKIEGNSVLSVYLHTDPAQDPKASYRIWLKDALRALEDELEPSERKRFREAAERLKVRVQELRPQGKSWVAFVGEDLFEEYDLRVPVENEVRWGRPELTQLEWLLGEYRPYGVVLADSEKLRFFVVAMNEIREVDERALELETTGWRRKHLMPPSRARGSPVRGAIGGGDQRDAYAERIKVQTERFWKEASEVLRRLKETDRVEELVLGGPKAVRERFLQALGAEAERVIAQIPLPLDAPPSEILEASLKQIQAHERQREEQIVAELLRRASTSDRAGVGLSATLKALQEGRVEQVVTVRNLEAGLNECRACGYVFEGAGKSCPNCFSDRPRQSSLRELLPLLLRRYGASLEIVRGPAAEKLAPHGGIGALWRY